MEFYRYDRHSGEEMKPSAEQEVALKEISTKLAEVDRLIGECVKIAKEKDVPFTVAIEGVHNTFEPNSEYAEYDVGGWQSSMC